MTAQPRDPASAASGSTAQPAGHVPHKVLGDYYPAESDRRKFLDRIFDETSVDYDRIEKLIGFGSGPWYRQQALLRAGLAPGMRVVDVGVGTGLVADAAAEIVKDARLVIGVDPSDGMMAHARLPEGVRLLRGKAESIPLPDGSADFISMGFALRHVGGLDAAFHEFRRVLAPGGRLLIMELTRPEGRVGSLLLKTYLRNVVPAIARLSSRSRDTPTMWRYYWDTIEACVPPASVMDELRAAGLADVARRVEVKIFSEYTARRA